MTLQAHHSEPTKEGKRPVSKKADKSLRMSEDDYDLRRDGITKRVNDAVARYEQELSRLFIQSGWTQEELAEKEMRSQSWVDQHLRFGRFLEWVTTSGGNADNLSERRFRGYWSQTHRRKHEGERFQQVVDLIEGKITAADLIVEKKEKKRPAVASENEVETVTAEWLQRRLGLSAPASLVIALLNELAEVLATTDPATFAQQCSSEKRELVLSHVDIVRKWLALVTEELERAEP